MRFARTLRVNYQQLGDADGANRAMNVELQATEMHLEKTWRSNEAYYRKKYAGVRRFRGFLEWSRFGLQISFGNGERPLKLARATILILLVLAVIDVWAIRGDLSLGNCVKAMLSAPQVFLGTLS